MHMHTQEPGGRWKAAWWIVCCYSSVCQSGACRQCLVVLLVQGQTVDGHAVLSARAAGICASCAGCDGRLRDAGGCRDRVEVVVVAMVVRYPHAGWCRQLHC